MVKTENLPTEKPLPERPWFKIGGALGKQEEAIRIYAMMEGYKDLRGFWAHLKKEGWDYYDVIINIYRP